MREHLPARYVAALLVVGVSVIILAHFMRATAQVKAQVREETKGSVDPYGTARYDGLLPEGVEDRAAAEKRLQSLVPDPQEFPVPRTPWDGKPDFSGVYWAEPTMVPPPIALNSLYLPTTLELMKGRDPDDNGSQHCWPGSPARGGLGAISVQLAQGPGILAVIDEYMGSYRLITTSGREHNPNARRTFQGESTGRWEGDTLVVDVTNFRDRRPLDMLSDSLHVIERWTRPDARVLEREIVVEDVKVFTGQWIGPKIRRGREEYDTTTENHCVQDDVIASTLKDLQEFRAKEAVGKGTEAR